MNEWSRNKCDGGTFCYYCARDHIASSNGFEVLNYGAQQSKDSARRRYSSTVLYDTSAVVR